MNEEALENVSVPPQMGASHSAGLIHVREASFDSLSTAAQLTLAPLAANPSAIGVDGCLLIGLVDPVAPTAIRF